MIFAICGDRRKMKYLEDTVRCIKLKKCRLASLLIAPEGSRNVFQTLSLWADD